MVNSPGTSGKTHSTKSMGRGRTSLAMPSAQVTYDAAAMMGPPAPSVSNEALDGMQIRPLFLSQLPFPFFHLRLGRLQQSGVEIKVAIVRVERLQCDPMIRFRQLQASCNARRPINKLPIEILT